MKKILKQLGGFLVGSLIGAGLVVANIALFGDMSLAEFGRRLDELGVGRMVGYGLLGGLLATLAFSLHIVLHEGGHLLCGLLSGYRFLSFRVFSLTVVRQDGHLCLKRYKLAGTGGQCLLAPPGSPDRPFPYFWYYAGGVAMNLLVTLLAFCLWLVADGWPVWLRIFLLLLWMVGLFLAALNGIPAKMGGLCNDAYNIRRLRRHPADARYLWIQLSAAALIQTGTRPKDLPDEWFAPSDTPVDYSDLLQVFMPLMQVSRLQDEERWDEAYALLEDVYAHRDRLLGLLCLETEAELVFTALVLGQVERARSLWTDAVKNYVVRHSRVSSAKQRVLFAVSLWLEGDKSKAKTIFLDVRRRQNDYLMQGEACMDLALMEALAEKCRIFDE